jgi:hypothetical protein
MTHPSSLFVVVEGPSDARAIRGILGGDLAAKLRLFAAGGGMSRATLARNLLVHEGGPILVVMDADTTNPQLVDEQKSMAFLAISSVAPPSVTGLRDWVKVFAFVPEMEVIFFEAPAALEAMVGKRVSEEKLQRGLLAPKATLLKLLADCNIKYETFTANINPQVASILASGAQAHALITMTESLLTMAAEA